MKHISVGFLKKKHLFKEVNEIVPYVVRVFYNNIDFYQKLNRIFRSGNCLRHLF